MVCLIANHYTAKAFCFIGFSIWGSGLLEELARGYRVFGALGWGDLGDGHISARDPIERDCFWMLKYGVPFARAAADDMVLVNADGDLVIGTGEVNQPGYHIHQPILAARPDIVSAAHTHTPWGTPFSAEVRVPEPITQEACVFFEDCALFDDEEVQVLSVEAGSRIAQSLGRNRAIILRNHGLLTVGNSVAHSVAHFVMLERVAEAHIKTPNAKPISGDAARIARDDLVKPASTDSIFDFLTKFYEVA